jgi:hypothetical protein
MSLPRSRRQLVKRFREHGFVSSFSLTPPILFRAWAQTGSHEHDLTVPRKLHYELGGGS